MTPLRIGLFGSARINDIYFKHCAGFDGLDIISCGSLSLEEIRAKAVE